MKFLEVNLLVRLWHGHLTRLTTHNRLARRRGRGARVVVRGRRKWTVYRLYGSMDKVLRSVNEVSLVILAWVFQLRVNLLDVLRHDFDGLTTYRALSQLGTFLLIRGA